MWRGGVCVCAEKKKQFFAGARICLIPQILLARMGFLICTLERYTKTDCTLEITKVSHYRAPSLGQVGLCTLEVTKVSLSIVFSLLARWVFEPSKSPECRYLSCSPLWPGGSLRARSYCTKV